VSTNHQASELAPVDFRPDVWYSCITKCRLQSRGEDNISKDLRVNERIRVREVRLIGEAGDQLGVLPTLEALRIARERNLDLVEVAPTAVPPVCRLIDYGKFKYEQTKKEREARKNQKVVLLKEVRLTPKTDEHDIEFKSRTIQRFLEDGDKVKVTVRFKGREMAHPQLGRQVLDAIASNLRSAATVERTPLIEGRTMTMILSPAHGLKAAVPAGQAAPTPVPQPSAPAASRAATSSPS
jgi:translation initiation factor IF-3